MNSRRCLKIASRMNVLLKRELGQGIDPARMLAEPLYARDVLLVCDAMRETELAGLAPRYRHAVTAEGDDAGRSSGTRSGFSPSRFLNSIFGASTPQDAPPSGHGAARGRSASSRSHGK